MPRGTLMLRLRFFHMSSDRVIVDAIKVAQDLLKFASGAQSYRCRSGLMGAAKTLGLAWYSSIGRSANKAMHH